MQSAHVLIPLNHMMFQHPSEMVGPKDLVFVFVFVFEVLLVIFFHVYCESRMSWLEQAGDVFTVRSSCADATFVLSDLCIFWSGAFTHGLSPEGWFRKENLSFLPVVIAGFNSLFRIGR